MKLFFFENILSELPLWFILLCGIGLILRLYLTYKWGYFSRRGILGPTPSIMNFGNTKEIYKVLGRDKKSINQIDDWVDKYGKIFGVYQFTKPALVIVDPKVLKEVWIKQFSKFFLRTKGGVVIRAGNSITGKVTRDFLTSMDNNDQWHRVRNTMIKIMSTTSLTELLPLIQRAADSVIQEDIIDNGTHDVKDIAGRYTIKAIMSSAFSIDPYDLKAMDEARQHALNILPRNASMSKYMLLGMIPEWIRHTLDYTIYPYETSKFFKRLYNYLFTENLRRKKSNEIQFKDFSSQMMRHIIDEKSKYNKQVRKGFTPSEIYANSMLVISAGHETTASTLQFVMFMLAIHPQVQERLYKTIKKDKMEYEDIKSLKYLDAIIKETMRIYPPTIVNDRLCNERTVINGNVVVEPGTTILWFTPHIHMNEEYFPEPNKFDPDRWEGNESNTLQDDYWVAFGQGPRSCPGVRWGYLTMKSLIVSILKKFELTRCAETPNEIPNQMFDGLKMTADKPMIVKFKVR